MRQNSGRGLRRTHVVGVLDATEQRGERGFVEGEVARHHHEARGEEGRRERQDHAAAPNVAETPVVAGILEDLGGDVVRAAAGGVLQGAAVVGVLADERGQAEVGNLDVHVLVQEQVLGLDVAMGHAEAVQAAQCEERLVDDGFEEAWVVAQRPPELL